MKHLARLEELVKDASEVKRKPLNYANYTKENYNILTLEKHNNYYQNFQQKIPIYIREQPDWTKSSYKRKNTKITKHNYILFRNVKNLRESKSHSKSIYNVPRCSLYRINKSFNEKSCGKKSVSRTISKGRERSVTETLPLINKSQKNPSSCYESKSRGGVSGITGMSETEQLIKRAEQLGKFVQAVKTEEGKEMAKSYAKELIGKMKASDITKERMKIALLSSADELQKIFEDHLGIKIDIEDTEKKPEEINTQSLEENKGDRVDDKKKIKEIEEKIAALYNELASLQSK